VEIPGANREAVPVRFSRHAKNEMRLYKITATASSYSTCSRRQLDTPRAALRRPPRPVRALPPGLRDAQFSP